MQLSELTTEVLERLGVPASGDPSANTAKATKWINTALRRISAERDWWWNLHDAVGLVFNNGAAAMPTDCSHIIGLSVEGYPITQIARSDYLAQATSTNLPEPFGWVQIGDELRLAPAPAGVTTATLLLYYRTEPVLVNPTDTPRMPAAHHDALVDYAVAVGWLSKQDASRATPALASYNAWVATMGDDTVATTKGRIRDTRSGTPPRISATGFTFLTAPGPYAGGIIVCTSLTHPLGVEGQFIYETDTDRLLVYDSTEADFVVPKQIREESIWSIMTPLPF